MADPNAQIDSLNQQITDSIKQMQQLMSDSDGEGISNYINLVTAHAVSLALYNTVQQQQQAYILQNAITTAAAKAILETNPENALALAREGFGDNNLADTIESLFTVLASVDTSTQASPKNSPQSEQGATNAKKASK